MIHQKLRSLIHHVKKILAANVPMETLSSEQWKTLRSAIYCHVCEKPFALNDNRVSNRCHLTDRYRGLTHSNCNLNYKNSYFIPIIFQAMTHFIIKEIAYQGNIDFLPITKENIYHLQKMLKIQLKDQIRIIKLWFIDSYNF